MNKRLYKSNNDKVIAGVCGGVAEYFGIDSAIVRLGFVFAAFALGTGLVFYILAAVIVPDKPRGARQGDIDVEATIIEENKTENRYSYDESRYSYYDTQEKNEHEYNEYNSNNNGYNYDPDKKLYRSNKNKLVAGVCGGLGEYFKIDPTIIRIVALLLILAYGTGFLVYIIAWLVMPERIH